MSLYRRIIPFLKPHAKQLLLGLVGMAVFTLLTLLPPLFLRYLVNDVIQPKAWNLLLPVIVLIISVPLLSAAIQFWNGIIIHSAGYRFILDVRLAIYRKIFSLSMTFHQENSAGLLVNRLMDDVNAVMQLVTGNTVTLIINLIVFVFSVSIVFTLSVPIAFILIGILIMYVFAYRFFAKRIKAATTSFRSYYDRINERLEETVAGVRHVRIFNRELYENDQFLIRTSESLRHATAGRLNSVSLSTVCTAIAGLGSAAISSVGAYYVLQGRLQYGDIFAISSYIWMALNPAIALTTIAGQLSETFVSVRRIAEILSEEPAIKSAPGAPDFVPGAGRVEFRDVRFSYVPDVPLYHGLSLEVEAGMTVALVGHTGCGKTTFTSLLMRYWDIQGGEILIDGQNIRGVTIETLRKQFGVVLQDPVVFDGTIKENITYGYRNAPMARIEEAARAAEIYNSIMRLPDGFDTVIGTEGVKLSVGEKQRLSIARAIIKDPLILIMDEATSSLDSESEALIQKALSTVLHGRTSFVVAHRLSTITSADMIVVMDAGAIVEKGTHAELMAVDGGHYRQLYEELQGKRRTAAV